MVLLRNDPQVSYSHALLLKYYQKPCMTRLWTVHLLDRLAMKVTDVKFLFLFSYITVDKCCFY